MAGDWNNSRDGERSGSSWRSASSHRKGGRTDRYQRREENGGRRWEDRRYDDRREGRRYEDRRDNYGRSGGRYDRDNRRSYEGRRGYDDRRGYEDRRGGSRWEDRRYDDRRESGRYEDRRYSRGYDRDNRRYDDRRGYEDRRGGSHWEDRRYDNRREGGRYEDRRDNYGRSGGRYDRDNRRGYEGRRGYDDRRKWEDRPGGSRQEDRRYDEGREGRFEDRRGRDEYSQRRDSHAERQQSYREEDNRRFDERRGKGNAGYGRPRDPMIPEEISARDLDPESRRHLSSLTKDMADKVARHLVYAGAMMDVNPELAYEHARAAYRHAARIDIVREALGLAAYLSGRYSEALRELRTFRRMTEDYSHVAIEADSERGLGRAEKALAFIAEIPLKKLDPEAQIELVLVTSGARADVGDYEGGLSALEHLKVENLDDSLRSRVELIRADRLEELGREEEAEALRKEWSPVYDAEVSIGEVEEEETEEYFDEDFDATDSGEERDAEADTAEAFAEEASDEEADEAADEETLDAPGEETVEESEEAPSNEENHKAREGGEE